MISFLAAITPILSTNEAVVFTADEGDAITVFISITVPLPLLTGTLLSAAAQVITSRRAVSRTAAHPSVITSQ